MACRAYQLTGFFMIRTAVLTKSAFNCSKSRMESPEHCEICFKLTKKTPKQHHSRCCGILIAYFEQISHTGLVFSLLDLNK